MRCGKKFDVRPRPAVQPAGPPSFRLSKRSKEMSRSNDSVWGRRLDMATHFRPKRKQRSVGPPIKSICHLSMAMPVMVRVETKVTHTGIMPVSWQTICAFGPAHLLKSISTRVTGETTVQRRRSLTARLTISMLLTCKNEARAFFLPSNIGWMCSARLLPPSVSAEESA